MTSARTTLVPNEGTPVQHTLSITRYDATDPRLGRHVHHDSRSLDYEFLR